MPYEQKYCDAKFDLENFALRNVIIIDFVRLQFPSREVLAIEPKSLPVFTVFGTLPAHSGGGGDTHTSERSCTCRAPLRPAFGQ